MDEVILKTCLGCSKAKPLESYYKNGRYGHHCHCKDCMSWKGEQLDREFRERFWSRVDKNGPEPAHVPGIGGCWLWTGSKHKFGYGWQRFQGYTEVAHRVAWFLEYGKMPDEKCVLHRCDVAACVRISHLFEGSDADNMRDKARKGRAGWPGLQGDEHGMAKLTEPDIYEIRKLWDDGCGQRDIAEQFGLSRIHASRIGRRQSWKHLPERS